MNATMEPLATSSGCGCCGTTLRRNAAWPLAALLRETAAVLETLSDAQYVQSPVGVMPGSVGGHVRHCLDHVTALLAAVETGRLDYDHRQRGTPVERDRGAALRAIREAALQLATLDDALLERPVRLEVLLSADAEPVEVASSVGRELAYVLSHTIHHNAILGAMVKTLGGTLPEHFGYAPSTLRAARQRRAADVACAR